MSSSWWLGTRLRMLRHCKTATSNKGILCKLLVRSLVCEGNAYKDGQMFPRKTVPTHGKQQSMFVKVN